MSNKITVDMMQCGLVELDYCGLYQDETAHYPFSMLLKARSNKHHLVVPVYTFLITHPNGAKILYDTAWGSEVRDHPWRALAAARLVDRPLLPEHSCVDEQLAMRGLKPEDLDYVILSHLHIDHAGGIRDLKGAKSFLVAPDEYKAGQKGGLGAYRKRMWKGVKFDFMEYEETGIGPVGKSQDLFGDGTVILVSTPGHSDGHTALLLRNNGKQLLLTGDNGYSRKSWQVPILPGILSDDGLMAKSLLWNKEFYDSAEGLIDVISPHETDLAKHYYEL